VSMITLHPRLGFNPHMCYCPRCGGESPELMLIGNRTNVRECSGCKKELIGFMSSERCPTCGELAGAIIRTIGEHDKLPGGLCVACQEEVHKEEAIVKAGGVYFRCLECGKRGVIIASSRLAKGVRKTMKIAAPAPCGVEFGKCAEHTPGEEKKS
jgi:hypothetical protein